LALTPPLLTQFLSYTTTPTGWVLLLSSEPFGWFCHLQLYSGYRSRHCHGINYTHNKVVKARIAKLNGSQEEQARVFPIGKRSEESSGNIVKQRSRFAQ
jgi:hypothetical protein